MTRGRKETATTEVVDVQMNEPAFDRLQNAATELAVANHQASEKVTALARTLNYQGSTDPAVLENSARDAIRRMGMTIFELGGYLLLLKEACPHGHFIPALERLELAPATAQRYMQVTRRFANAASARHLESVGFQKVVELLPLDDEQIENLTEFGQTNELALDDVARMSVKQLRAAVRKVRQDKARLEQVNKEMHDEVIGLKLQNKVVAHTDWPAALEPVSHQVAAAGRALAQAVSELESCRMAIFSAGHELDEKERVAFENALAHVATVYEEALQRAEQKLERERVTFDKTLGAYTEEGA